MDKTVAGMVEEARSRIENLNPDEVAEALSEAVVLIDLREEDELRGQGWIPDSIWAPRGMLEFWADPVSPYHRTEFDPARRIVLYCATGGRSALATDTLVQMGYRDVSHLEGGLKAWKDSGRPVERP
jgi:rhodanese-related sulfurtransferase